MSNTTKTTPDRTGAWYRIYEDDTGEHYRGSGVFMLCADCGNKSENLASYWDNADEDIAADEEARCSVCKCYVFPSVN